MLNKNNLPPSTNKIGDNSFNLLHYEFNVKEAALLRTYKQNLAKLRRQRIIAEKKLGV